MKKYISYTFLILISAYFLYLIRPAIFGDLKGSFKPSGIQNEYVVLEELLSSDSNYYRTFWIPQSQRFSFYSSTHPIISSDRLLRTNDPLLAVKTLEKENLKTYLQELSVRYVIVPYDSEGEIFLEDRKYSNDLYLKTVRMVEDIEWLKRVPGFAKIAVFELENPKDHFFLEKDNIDEMTKISYRVINPVEYHVAVKNVRQGNLLIFSEGYDKNWTAEAQNQKIKSQEFSEKLNSFALPESGSYSLKIYYSPQENINLGLWISGITTLFLITFLLFVKMFRK